MIPRSVALAWLAAMPMALVAQVPTNSTATSLGRALMAERNGAYADAASQYVAILKAQPANLGALTGMEHLLPRLDRRTEMVGLVTRALLADSSSVGVLGVAVRTFAANGQPDSARKYVDRWSARAVGDEDPYREWAEAAIQARDLAQATLALDLGRQRLGPNALSLERAQLLQRSGDIAGATREWIAVVQETPPFRDGAVTMLAQVSLVQRSAVAAALRKDGTLAARQLLGLLLAGWGDASEGAAVIRNALPQDAEPAKTLLRALYERLRPQGDKAARLAAAATLEAIAQRETGAAAVHTLMDAARVYAEAGDEREARRVLAIVGANPAAGGGVALAASSTLLQVLIAEGKAVDAERALASLGEKVDADEHDRLLRRIAMVWVRAGDLARAGQLIAGDSSTAGFDLRGRLRLFVGDLAGANDLLKQAGPYDEEREQALGRVALLTLIQAIGQDSSPSLGTALLALERGDSARAITGLASLAGTLRGGGAAETRLLAGRLALARRDTTLALELLQQADLKDAPATAAAARFDLARIDIAAGRTVAGRTRLEQLILDFPESAVVPEARRLRDSLRGAVPGSR